MHYQWQEIPTTFIDRKLREYQVTARQLVALDEEHPDGIQTGLCYIQSYPPMYHFFNDPMTIGCYGSYLPLHLTSHEQLLSSCWSNEKTIQFFLQRLFEASPEPSYWCAAKRADCVEQFPGRPVAIDDLIEQSVKFEGQSKTPQVIQLICTLMFGEGYMNPIPPKQTKLEPEALALIHEAGAEEGTHQSPHFSRSYYWYVVGEMLYCEVERRPGEYLDLFRKVQGIRCEC